MVSKVKVNISKLVQCYINGKYIDVNKLTDREEDLFYKELEKQRSKNKRYKLCAVKEDW